MDWSNQTSLSSLGSDGDQGEDELDCQHKSSAPFLPRWLPKSVVVALLQYQASFDLHYI